MPGPGIGQPNLPGTLVFSLKNVDVLGGGGLAPSAVLNVGETFTIRTDLGVTGLLAGLLAGDTLEVVHHVENIETGTRTTIPGGTVTVPPPPAAGDFKETAGPFTAGTQLPIPAGYASGTYRILTHIHAQSPAIAPIVAAFHDGLIIMVVPKL